MEEDARYRYQGKHYRARSSRTSDYHSDKLEISQEKDEADSPAGNGRFYRAQQSRGSDIHPDGLPGTFQQVQGEASDFEAEDYEADYEVGTAIILSQALFFTCIRTFLLVIARIGKTSKNTSSSFSRR